VTKKFHDAQNENAKLQSENKTLIDQLIALKMAQAQIMDELTDQMGHVATMKAKLETQVEQQRLHHSQSMYQTRPLSKGASFEEQK